MGVEVSVVIPARDEARAIGGCLRALAAQTVGASALDVIVVAAGTDGTAAAAERAAADAGFGRMLILPLAHGNKNVALQVGCARATAPVVVLLDADTEPAPDAIGELGRAVRDGPERAVHGAATPRFDTWISRYWELNRKLVKELRFDGALSGELIALRRATLDAHDLAALFPAETGAKDDLHLARALAARGCAIGYVRTARATTLVPWTLAGLATTMLRNRRGAMAVVAPADAARQAAKSTLLVAALPAALLAARWSSAVALAFLAPLLFHAAVLAARVETLRRRGLGDYRSALPSFLALDLLARALKLWAWLERIAGRQAPRTFRGERPDELRAGAVPRGAA